MLISVYKKMITCWANYTLYKLYIYIYIVKSKKNIQNSIYQLYLILI